MSWSIEEHIGEGRPWPEQVVVYRGETDESLTYARRSLSDVNKMVELMDTLAAENAKLREQIHRLKQGDILHVLTDQEYIDQCERERLMQVSIDALDKENAKLRELVADMWFWHYEGHIDSESQERQMLHIDAVIQRMRELEVDG